MFVNLTNRLVKIKRPDGSFIELPRTNTPKPKYEGGYCADEEVTPDGVKIPACWVDDGRVVGIPAPQPGVWYIVTDTIADLLHNTRPDCVTVYNVDNSQCSFQSH